MYSEHLIQHVYIFAVISYLLRYQNAKLIVVDRLPIYSHTLHELFSLLLSIQVPRLVHMEPSMLIHVTRLSITDVCGVDQ